MKKKLTQKDQITIAIIIFIFIMIVFYFIFALEPLLKKIFQYVQEEKVINAQLLNAENMVLDKEKLTKEVEEISNKIKYFEEKLPGDIDVPQILDELIAIGKKNNVVFVSIEPKSEEIVIIDEASGSRYIEAPIALRLKAGFHEFAAFINGIENFKRFIKIDDVRIASDSADFKKHNINLTVSAFGLEGEILNHEKGK